MVKTENELSGTLAIRGETGLTPLKSGEILLLNDSFPPLIDGVANAVLNYARVL